MNIILIYFSIKYKGDWNAIYKALENKERVTLKEISELEEKMKENKWKAITIIDREYPEQLKQAYKPPFVIWIKGNEDLLNNSFIALTGNQVNEQVKTWIKNYEQEVEKSNRIVSGSFLGVDEKISCENKKGILYILANGVDHPYIHNKLKKNDLMLTEYPPEYHVTKSGMRNRNRLIAAFANYLVLLSSKKDGPINHLITNFLNLGKDIYCFPGNGDEEDGNSELIKQGATLVTKIKDIRV